MNKSKEWTDKNFYKNDYNASTVEVTRFDESDYSDSIAIIRTRNNASGYTASHSVLLTKQQIVEIFEFIMGEGE